VDVTDYLLYLYAESPVHTGAAGSADVLDLPVQREAATGYPVIWGQSLKGALRQAARDSDWDERTQITPVFGSKIGDAGEEGGTDPGTLAVGDAQLVAMPVPTLRSTFAWLTSEIALSRLARKYLALAGPGRKPRPAIPPLPSVAPDEGAAASGGWTQEGREVLGPYLLPLREDTSLAAWAARLADDVLAWDPVFQPFAGKLRADLILAGRDMVPELLRQCTEQAVRVQLEEKEKKVKNGPFYSEYLPAETIMAASLTLRGAGDTKAHQQALRELLDRSLLRIGGDETLGKGLMWSRLIDAEAP
jgi:CRISPR-associated protein Cmr4